MYIFIWKFTGYSKCCRALGIFLSPEFSVKTLLKMMPFPRGVGMNGPMRRPFRDDYDYKFGPRGGMSPPSPRPPPPHSAPARWMMPRDLPPIRQVAPVNVNCGELRPADRGTRVYMMGRVQYQRLSRFISLRDSHGTTQLVAMEERSDLMNFIPDIPLDSRIEVIGTVELRPSHTVNKTMQTGEIEVIIDEIVQVDAPKRKFFELSGEEVPGKKSRSSVLITSGEIIRCETPSAQKKFRGRTHNCGELNETKINLDVILCGWIESKRNERFALLRDGYGAAQLVFNTNDPTLSRTVQSAVAETLVKVKGKVSLRPAHQRNTRMATGNIEIKVESMEIIDRNEPLQEDDSENVGMVEESAETSPAPGDVNSYCARSHTCGELQGSDVGKEVVLCGWLDSQRTNRFATIRDGHGCTQLLIPSIVESTLGKEMVQTPLESVISVAGTVCARPPEQFTDKISTGEIEVIVKEYTVLNPAKRDLPFITREHNRPKENLRMKYRYLDLRFSDMQYRLRLRSKVLMRMREFLINQRGFVEVETPTLFKRTPGGAQEYIVPTRTPDKFYSLVQSPQQLKQLLMVGAVDRYFQVARCYRDEGARPDRQPEFTQMDIELSFTDRESILTLVEDLLKASWPEDLKSIHTPFPRITYQDAMRTYGSDKPDLSFDNKLIDITSLIKDEKRELVPEKLRTVDEFTAKALVFGPSNISKLREGFKECGDILEKKPNSKAKLLMVKCTVNNWTQNINKALPYVDAEELKNLLKFQIPSTVVVGIGKESEVLPLLGKLRQVSVDVCGSRAPNFHFAWIVDFPLFLEGDDGSLESAHHPFTQPHTEDVSLLDSAPSKVRGLHFDLVLNGFEVGGGSVRIHNSAMQTKVLKEILKLPIDSLEHLIEALESGAPPHGGIALGMDRLMSIMVGAETIRDVIAFPKGVDGKDPLSGAPCSISEEEKKIYHLLPKKTE